MAMMLPTMMTMSTGSNGGARGTGSGNGGGNGGGGGGGNNKGGAAGEKLLTVEEYAARFFEREQSGGESPSSLRALHGSPAQDVG